MASAARAKQGAVLITWDRSRKMMGWTSPNELRQITRATRPMNWATDAINVVPTKTITSKLADHNSILLVISMSPSYDKYT